MQRWIFINHPPSFLFLPFFPSFSSLCLLSPSSLLLSPAPDSRQSQPDVQTLAVPTSLPTAYDNAAMFLPIGNLDNCGRWLLLKRGDGKQLALTHRATAAPQIVTLLQIVATNYTLPRYSDGGVDCQFFSSATQKGKSKMCYNLHVQLMFMYGNPRLLRFVCACLFACTNIKVL